MLTGMSEVAGDGNGWRPLNLHATWQRVLRSSARVRQRRADERREQTSDGKGSKRLKIRCATLASTRAKSVDTGVSTSEIHPDTGVRTRISFA